MEVYNNYSVCKVFSLIEYENRTPEVIYLNDVITKYIIDTREKITEVLAQLPNGTRADVMKWIDQNVDADIQYYVRCAYLGKPYNVLKKGKDTWKRVSDIGVLVLKKDSQRNINNTEWLEILNNKATDLMGNCLTLYESHAHYDLQQYDGIRKELMLLMHGSGIQKCIIPAIEYDAIKKCMDMFDESEYEWIYYAVGSHPKYIWKEKGLWNDERWQELKNMLGKSKCCAVGEIGLDYSYTDFNEEDREFQKEMFIKFIKEANEAKLPVILHIRPAEGSINHVYDAHKDAIAILNEYPVKCGAVLHCFGGSYDLMKEYMEVGVYYFGIGGRILYMMKDLEDAVRQMPDDSIILETDSPYIRLEGDRMPNTSLSLYEVAKLVAKLRGVKVEQIADVTAENFKRLFSKIDVRK